MTYIITLLLLNQIGELTSLNILMTLVVWFLHLIFHETK